MDIFYRLLQYGITIYKCKYLDIAQSSNMLGSTVYFDRNVSVIDCKRLYMSTNIVAIKVANVRFYRVDRQFTEVTPYTIDRHLSTVGLPTIEYSPLVVHYIPPSRLIYNYNRRRIGLTINVAETYFGANQPFNKKQKIQIKFLL